MMSPQEIEETIKKLDAMHGADLPIAIRVQALRASIEMRRLEMLRLELMVIEPVNKG